MGKYFLFFLTSFAFIINTGILKAQWVTNHSSIFHGNVTQPAVGSTINDLKFGTQIKRITDSRSLILKGIVPVYSKRQAWNSDESRLLLGDYGNGNVRLYNGLNYQFIDNLSDVSGDDIFWSPTDPDLIYFNPDSVLYSYRISTSQIKQLHNFSPYNYANTKGEGNLSNDGRYYAVVGWYYNRVNGDVKLKEILVCDLQTNVIIKSMLLPENLEDFDWVSISPLGNYVVVDYADKITGRYHGIEVYDRNLNFIWQKPIGPGHSDMGTDANNQEVLIMDKYDDDLDSTFIMKYRLSDGQETKLMGLSARFDLHISYRNQLRRDWCFISTFDFTDRLKDDSLSWLPFEDEIFALKTDGSKQVQRIAHHHSKRYSPTTPDGDKSTYAAEPHATISRNGDRILFGSNWRINIEENASVDTYIADFKHFLGLIELPKTTENYMIVFPNPVSKIGILRFILDKKSTVMIVIKDITGKTINTVLNSNFTEGRHDIPLDCSSMPSGIYLIRLQTEKNSWTSKIEVIH